MSICLTTAFVVPLNIYTIAIVFPPTSVSYSVTAVNIAIDSDTVANHILYTTVLVIGNCVR